MTMRPERIIGSILLVLLVGAGIYLALTAPRPQTDTQALVQYREIESPAGFVNTEPFQIRDYVGEKVILVDFMTYSCINCQRTFPYVTAWYKAYKDDGLVVIGIHTPEFAFEKDIGNVRKAMAEFGITYPVVLDNDYATWRAYGNQYWPRKYLIDIHGNIVYDHIGEGAYEETEAKIRELLKERARARGEQPSLDDMAETPVPVVSKAQSPETYFGALRNEFLGNGASGRKGPVTFTLPTRLLSNTLYLGGSWTLTDEYATGVTGSVVSYRYTAARVHLVAEADGSATIEVWKDGVLYGTITVRESRLYTLIQDEESGAHQLELRIKEGSARFYAFTFG